MLRTTNNEALSTQFIENKKNQDAPSAAGGVDGGNVGGSIKNLSTATKSVKPKIPYFAKVKSGTDFLTPGAKKAFINLWKAFTKTSIFRHFDPERHIWIETNALGYAIGGILSQMTSDQHSSSHVTHKDPNSLKSEIS